MRLDPDFRPALARFDIALLEDSPHTILGARPDLTIGYRNPAWFRFAGDNGGDAAVRDGWCAPRTLLDGIARPVRRFFADLYTRVLVSGEPATHTYLCPSPTLHRRHRLRVQPLDPGLLLVHECVVERPHARPAEGPDLGPYLGADGLITVCCQCRAARRVDDEETWDWVPSLLEGVRDDISHGLCQLCFRHHHPELVAAWDARRAQRHR